MSKNSKNARLIAARKAMPKNRSAAARARRESGEVRQPGRASAPSHGKKKAWWQVFKSYRDYISGGGKKVQRAEKLDVEVDAA